MRTNSNLNWPSSTAGQAAEREREREREGSREKTWYGMVWYDMAGWAELLKIKFSMVMTLTTTILTDE